MLIKNALLPDLSTIDILIENDKIVKIGSEIIGTASLDLKAQAFISSGWIDAHAHAFNGIEFIGDDIDTIGIKSGVTTLIDAGTVGALNYDQIVTEKKSVITDVKSLLNISQIGIIRQNELANLDDLNQVKVMDLVSKEADIVGLKVRMSGSVVENNGITPLIIAKETATKLNVPLMIHIGNPPPDVDDVLKLLSKGDIITHCFHGKASNLFDNSSQTESLLLDCLKRGVLIDVGHGTDSFSFDIAKRAMQKGIYPNTISSDIYRKNRINGPVFDFATTMSKFLYVGYKHSDIITMVTKNAAEMFGLTEIGEMVEGKKADFTIYQIKDQEVELTDSTGKKVIANQKFVVNAVIKNGEYYQLEDNELTC